MARRGYLIVTADGARYVAESNHAGLRVVHGALGAAAGTSGSKVSLAAAVLAPGVYKASDEMVYGKHWRLMVGKLVDPAKEAARLRKLAADRPWSYHGQGRPGVKGYEQSMGAVQAAARQRKLGSRLLAEALEGLRMA